MTRMLIIGLVWVSISASAGVLIGLVIHRADLRDEEFPQEQPAPDDQRRGAVALPAVRTRLLVPRRGKSPARPSDGDHSGRPRPG
jgi:hypothetical protein